MRPATLLRRAGHGLGLLTMLAAAVVPLFATIAATHRGHWAGVGALDFWPGFVVPWAGRTWAVVLLVALAGWAASAAPAEPHRGRRALIGGGTGGAAAIICALAALPGWVWLARLGAADASALAAVAGLALLPLVVGGGVAGSVGAALGEGAGAAFGAAAGGGLLFATWGMFG